MGKLSSRKWLVSRKLHHALVFKNIILLRWEREKKIGRCREQEIFFTRKIKTLSIHITIIMQLCRKENEISLSSCSIRASRDKIKVTLWNYISVRGDLSFGGKTRDTRNRTKKIPSGVETRNIFINLASFPTHVYSPTLYVTTLWREQSDSAISL